MTKRSTWPSLTGAVDAFCAGADLKSFVPLNYVEATPRRVREIVDLGFGGITRGLHRIPKPTIAAVNGWALAGGLELALACDLRVASDQARFGSFEARRGFHHGDGGITRLVNTCGVGVAMQLVLTAEPIDAPRALQCNLVASVVPHDELAAAADALAAQILRNSQRAVRSAKETILEVIGKPLDDQLRVEGWNSYSVLDRVRGRGAAAEVLRGRGVRGWGLGLSPRGLVGPRRTAAQGAPAPRRPGHSTAPTPEPTLLRRRRWPRPPTPPRTTPPPHLDSTPWPPSPASAVTLSGGSVRCLRGRPSGMCRSRP